MNLQQHNTIFPCLTFSVDKCIKYGLLLVMTSAVKTSGKAGDWWKCLTKIFRFVLIFIDNIFGSIYFLSNHSCITILAFVLP